MKRLKKFNELFDDEDLKARHEIDYLSGKLKNITVDSNFKDESMMYFISKLSMVHYPMFIAFDEANKQENGILSFGKFEVLCDYDEEDETWALIARSEKHCVTFMIKIYGVNNYDLSLYLDTEGTDPDDEISNPGFEYVGITYTKIIQLIEGVYIPLLKEAGLHQLIDYKSELGREIKN